ncbi:MAG: hypothetical protein JOZ39_04455 [Chloroflexi bacterium]|nr:hypothetical protein [Chloroflexota bacterium]
MKSLAILVGSLGLGVSAALINASHVGGPSQGGLDVGRLFVAAGGLGSLLVGLAQCAPPVSELADGQADDRWRRSMLRSDTLRAIAMLTWLPVYVGAVMGLYAIGRVSFGGNGPGTGTSLQLVWLGWFIWCWGVGLQFGAGILVVLWRRGNFQAVGARAAASPG